jgi:4-hydroxymandelate oxidase
MEEHRWQGGLTRRRALASLAGVLAGSPFLRAQIDPRPLWEHKRALGLNEMLTAFDFEPVFFSNVPLSIYDYTAHGDGSEYTARRNREAFDWVDIVSGKAVDPKSVDLSVELFGTKMSSPFMVAPTATMVPVHPDGEAGMAKACAGAGNAGFIISANASQPVEKIAGAAQGPVFWWQLYPQQSMGANQQLIDRAQTAGCKAIVVTVDQQASVYDRTSQDRNLGGRETSSSARRAAAAASGPALYRVSPTRLWYTWQMLDDLRKIIKVPLVVKGIATAEDAALCLQHGVDGIYVSNHGGRSVDYGPSTLEIMPEIMSALGGKVPVIFDSGIRRGADAYKAIALGAKAVALGRVPRWGLGAFGTAGAQKMLQIMQAELVETAARAGRTTLASIDNTAVRARFV